MQLKLGSLELDLSRIDLILSLNSVPSLRLLTEERIDTSTIKEIVGSGERAELLWQDDTLEVSPFGFDKSKTEASESEAYIHALLLTENLEAWFTTKPDAPETLNYGIHQNQSDIGGWTFLNSCLGYQFLTPINDYKERIDKILPISTCLTRPIRQDNQQYLGTVIGYLQHHLPELVGWTSVHTEHEALRFVFFDEENAFGLNESWENLSVNLPLRFVPGSTTKTEVRKTGFQVQADEKMSLLQTLAQHGIQTPLSGFLEAGNEDELLYLPGPVKLGEMLLLCEAITYSFAEENDTLITTLKVSSGLRTPASTVSSSRFEGMFKAWDVDDAEEINVFLATPDNTTWQMMDLKDSNLLNPSADLMAEFILPTTPNDEFSGMYVRRLDGDRLIFKVENFKTPTIYGSHQVLTEKLEAATVSLNTEVLALSGAAKDTGINEMQGIVVNAETMMHRTAREIEADAGTITLGKNIEVEKYLLSIVSTVDIANSATVDKVKVTGVPSGAFVPDAGINYGINVNKMSVAGIPAVISNLQEDVSDEPDVISAYWGSSVARREETLSLRGRTVKHPDGTPATFTIYEKVQDKPQAFITQVSGSVLRDTARAAWQFEYNKDVTKLRCIPTGDTEYFPPEYIFDLEVGGKTARSGLIEFKDWVEIKIIDKDDNSIPYKDIDVHFADGSVREVTADDKGIAILKDIPPGKVHVDFSKSYKGKKGTGAETGAGTGTGVGPQKDKQVISAKWDSDAARKSEHLKLSGKTQGFPNGTAAKFLIYEHLVHENDLEIKPGAAEGFIAQPKLIKEIEATVNNDQVTTEWLFDHDSGQTSLFNKYSGDEDNGDIFSGDNDYYAPEYFFDLEVEASTLRSEVLPFKDWLELDLLGENDAPLANVQYLAYLADGSKKSGRTDDTGKIILKDIPPGWVHIKLK